MTPFCLRRSPDHGTVKVVVVVVVTTFILKKIFAIEISSKNIFLDNIDVINCANFGNYVTSTFDKNSKKRFDDFTFFPVFDNFDQPNDLKIQF